MPPAAGSRKLCIGHTMLQPGLVDPQSWLTPSPLQAGETITEETAAVLFVVVAAWDAAAPKPKLRSTTNINRPILGAKRNLMTER